MTILLTAAGLLAGITIGLWLRGREYQAGYEAGRTYGYRWGHSDGFDHGYMVRGEDQERVR